MFLKIYNHLVLWFPRVYTIHEWTKKKRMLGGSNSGLFDSDADSAQKNARYEDRTHDLRIIRWNTDHTPVWDRRSNQLSQPSLKIYRKWESNGRRWPKGCYFGDYKLCYFVFTWQTRVLFVTHIIFIHNHIWNILQISIFHNIYTVQCLYHWPYGQIWSCKLWVIIGHIFI